MRDLPPQVDPDDRDEEPGGHLSPTGPGPLVVLGSLGLVAGWAWRGIAIRAGAATPSLSWTAVGVVWFVAAVTAGIAYLTWRTVHRERLSLTAEQGLKRLALGKTIDRLGAFALGGCGGMLISTIGVQGEASDRLVLHAALGLLGAAACVAAGLLLEHACRVPPGTRTDLR
ncbi:MAG: DUF3180 domain-containing protein [Marmoricola sp.]